MNIFKTRGENPPGNMRPTTGALFLAVSIGGATAIGGGALVAHHELSAGGAAQPEITGPATPGESTGTPAVGHEAVVGQHAGNIVRGATALMLSEYQIG